MSRSDRLGLLLSLVAVLVAYYVADRVFEHMAHLEDEMAYVWQAQALARGRLTLSSPPEPDSFLVPFVVDYNGQRFGKYPLGWPVLLSLGVRLGLRGWVNPLLAGLGVWLTYRLGKRAFSEVVGLLAAVLTLTSPFFLINAGSLLSHPFGLVLSAALALAWLDLFFIPSSAPRWMPVLTAGLSLGLLALSRPLTAVGVGLPFALHGLYLLVRGSWLIRRRLLVIGGIALALGLLHFVWQYAVTGDPMLNPYTLWWEYDSIGFGPGVGRGEDGHTLHQAYINTRQSLRTGTYDLFGWGFYSWIFLPFGLLATLRNPRGLLLAGVFPSLLLVYLAYWIGSSLFGPRYYYEGLYSLTLLSGAGIALLAGWAFQPGAPAQALSGWQRLRTVVVSTLLVLLIASSVLFYIPVRVGGMYGLYSIRRDRLQPFLSSQAQELTPALVIVHPRRWMEYGALLELQDPFLDTPFIFVPSHGAAVDKAVAAHFPERSVYHYYPDEPYRFYTAPR